MRSSTRCYCFFYRTRHATRYRAVGLLSIAHAADDSRLHLILIVWWLLDSPKVTYPSRTSDRWKLALINSLSYPEQTQWTCCTLLLLVSCWVAVSECCWIHLPVRRRSDYRTFGLSNLQTIDTEPIVFIRRMPFIKLNKWINLELCRCARELKFSMRVAAFLYGILVIAIYRLLHFDKVF